MGITRMEKKVKESLEHSSTLIKEAFLIVNFMDTELSNSKMVIGMKETFKTAYIMGMVYMKLKNKDHIEVSSWMGFMMGKVFLSGEIISYMKDSTEKVIAMASVNLSKDSLNMKENGKMDSRKTVNKHLK